MSNPEKKAYTAEEMRRRARIGRMGFLYTYADMLDYAADLQEQNERMREALRSLGYCPDCGASLGTFDTMTQKAPTVIKIRELAAFAFACAASEARPRVNDYRLRDIADALEHAADLREAIETIWPHLTGHCFEGATPQCFGFMRDTISAVVPGLPYGSDTVVEKGET